MKRSRAKLPKNNVRAVFHGKPRRDLPKLRFSDDPGFLERSQQIDLPQQVDVRITHNYCLLCVFSLIPQKRGLPPWKKWAAGKQRLARYD